MKKTLLSLIGALTLATAPIQAQTFEQHGEVDISYAPQISLYGMTNQVIKTKIQEEFDLKFGKFSVYLSGAETTFSSFIDTIYFKPLIQSFDIQTGLRIDDLELYLSHNCTHPISESPISATDSNKNSYWINWSGITEVGVKYKW